MNLDISFLDISVLTLIGLVAIFGFYMGFAARGVKLPSLIGYMVLGIILGPSILNLFSQTTMDHLAFITNIALGFVAFTIGVELNISSLKRLGGGIISIILAESFGAFLVVGFSIYLLTRDLPLALIFAAMAPASAPAGTVAVIQEYKSKGSLTKALYAVVGFDDGLAIIIFGFAFALAKNLLVIKNGGSAENVLLSLIGPAREIGLSLILGSVIGFLFCFMVRKLQNQRDILVIVFGAVLISCGLSNQWHLSLIMTNMVVGFVLVNTRRKTLVHNVVSSLQNIMSLLFILFFCLAGAHLEIAALPSLGWVGIVYILARSAGLIGGSRIGARIGRVEDNIRKYIGLGILSQAGVAIGLSLIVKHELDQIGARYNLPDVTKIGVVVLTTITATCIFFEIVGPILTKIALEKAGEIPHDQPT